MVTLFWYHLQMFIQLDLKFNQIQIHSFKIEWVPYFWWHHPATCYALCTTFMHNIENIEEKHLNWLISIWWGTLVVNELNKFIYHISVKSCPKPNP